MNFSRGFLFYAIPLYDAIAGLKCNVWGMKNLVTLTLQHAVFTMLLDKSDFVTCLPY